MGARVLIVDDHPSFRVSARRMLVAGGYDVVGEAADGAEALRETHALRPDVVLLDVHLPDRNGFEVAEELARQARPPTVILVSSRARTDYGVAVDHARVAGFIAKADLSWEALDALLGTDTGRPR